MSKFTKYAVSNDQTNVYNLILETVKNTLGDKINNYNNFSIKKLISYILSLCKQSGWNAQEHAQNIIARTQLLTQIFINNSSNQKRQEIISDIPKDKISIYNKILSLIWNYVILYTGENIKDYDTNLIIDVAHQAAKECLVMGYSPEKNQREIGAVAANFMKILDISTMPTGSNISVNENINKQQIVAIISEEIVNTLGEEINYHKKEEINNLINDIAQICVARGLFATSDNEINQIKKLTNILTKQWSINKNLESESNNVQYYEPPDEIDMVLAQKISGDTNGRIKLRPVRRLISPKPSEMPPGRPRNRQEINPVQYGPEPPSSPQGTPGEPSLHPLIGLPSDMSDNDGGMGSMGSDEEAGDRETIFDAEILLPGIYAWKIYAGAVSYSYVKNLQNRVRSDSEGSEAARQELEMIINYFRIMDDSLWNKLYSQAKFEPKNFMIISSDGKLDTRSPELSTLDTVNAFWRRNLKNLPAWLYYMGIDPAGSRVVEEAMREELKRNEMNPRPNEYAGPYKNPLLIAIDKFFMGLRSPEKKRKIMQSIMSRYGIMRFNQKYSHNIVITEQDMEKEKNGDPKDGSLLRKSLFQKVSIKTKVSINFTYGTEETDGQIQDVIRITEMEFEVPDNEQIKKSIQDWWAANEDGTVEFPEKTITSEETHAGDTWIITPLSIDAARITVMVLNELANKAASIGLPVAIMPHENEEGEIPEQKNEDMAGNIIGALLSQYNSSLSTSSAYSAELMWITEIAMEISGLSRKFSEITMKSVNQSGVEAERGQSALPVGSFKNTNNLWQISKDLQDIGQNGIRLSQEHSRYDKYINKYLERSRTGTET